MRRRDDERSPAKVPRDSVHRTDRSRGARLRDARTDGILADASPGRPRHAVRSFTMKRIQTIRRIASALTLAALAACSEQPGADRARDFEQRRRYDAPARVPGARRAGPWPTSRPTW
jgi:hypothetical protein